ncbi:META domain-containing protein [Fusobacterium sp.]|uniref:META domain-containing protein n=1 Tax=Fusobacterium sp. TaxID=68766 RepID=UPI0025BF9623|nr:META domain-containing protein [Fusobacterium sp.]
MKKAIILLSMIVLVGACTNIQPQGPVQVDSVKEIVEKEYELVNLFPGQGLTVGFDEEGRIFGYSGLNRFFGKVEISNGNIVVTDLASTRMGGPKEDLIREDQYLSLLKGMKKIEQENGQLVLTNEKEEKLIFKKR